MSWSILKPMNRCFNKQSLPSQNGANADHDKHVQVDTRNMKSGENFLLIHNAHRAEDLVRNVQIYLSSDYPFPKQIAAAERWQTFEREWRNNAYRSPGRKDMVRLIGILSDFFFLGSLGPIKFTWVDALKNEDDESVLGYEDPPDPAQKSRCTIVMDPARVHYNPGMTEYNHKAGVLSTLLHECIHAFLAMYSCGDACKDTTCARHYHSSVLVGRGHGSAFWRISSLINATAPRLLGVIVDADPCLHIASNYVEYGVLPTDHEVEGFYFQKQDILRAWVKKARMDQETGRSDRNARAACGAQLMVKVKFHNVW